MAGTVDREPPLVGVAGVAEPAQLEDLAVGEDPVDVDVPGPVWKYNFLNIISPNFILARKLLN